MRAHDVSVLTFTAFLATLVPLLGWSVSPPIGLFAAALSGVLAGVLRRVYEPRTFQSWWVLPLVLTTTSGGVIVFLHAIDLDLRGYAWLALVLAPGCALLVYEVDKHTGSRCSLCSRRSDRSARFQCPRCGLLVCEKNCWSHEALRCKLCLENQVPVFDPDGRWWDRQFGPRFAEGHCQLCMAPVANADLRTCRRCGRPQCRHCWDMSNGQCSRCGWIVEELPPRLSSLLLRTAPPAV